MARKYQQRTFIEHWCESCGGAFISRCKRAHCCSDTCREYRREKLKLAARIKTLRTNAT